MFNVFPINVAAPEVSVVVIINPVSATDKEDHVPTPFASDFKYLLAPCVVSANLNAPLVIESI